MELRDHTLWVKLSLRVLQCVKTLKTTGAWVNFCKPWILVVYSRLTLGMVNEKLYCSDFYTTFWAGELLKPKNTHARDYKTVKYYICLLLQVIMVVFHSCKPWKSLTFCICFEAFHSLAPTFNLINFLQNIFYWFVLFAIFVLQNVYFNSV